MKVNKFFAYLCGAMLLAGAMTSCVEDEEDYAPAGPVSEDCMEVYFSADNLELQEFSPSEVDYSQVVIPVKVCRTYAAEAVSVPIVIKQSTDIFNAPEVVEFAAGATEATIEITLNNGELGLHRLDMSIEDPLFANPYKELDGKTVYSLQLDIYRWLKVCDAQLQSALYESLRPTTLEVKEGTSSYRLTSLWADGYDFHFTLGNDGKSYAVPESMWIGTMSGYPVIETGLTMGGYPLWAAFDGDPSYSYFINGTGMVISVYLLTNAAQYGWFDEVVTFSAE